jgi:DNA gyrase subunit A
MGRPARGVRGIRLKGDDYVVGMRCCSLEDLILTVTEEGYGKRTKLDEYRKTARGGQGVINIKTSKRNGNVVSIMTVTQDDNVMIITRNGKIIRIDSDLIRATGRAAQGVRLVKLEDKDQIAAADVIGDNGDEEDEGANGLGVLLH